MMENAAVGLYVDLGGFGSYAKNHGGSAAMALRARFVTRAMEIVRRHDMTPVRTNGDGILFIGESQEAALRAAFACAEEFAPDHPYFPIHVALHPGEIVETDDSGRAVKLAARITAAPHPGQPRPASVGTPTAALDGPG